jgi:hypothetical protein
MAGLTAERLTPKQGEMAYTTIDNHPVAASTKIYKGSMVALSAGYLVPASTSTSLIVVGRAEATVDNTTGSAGALFCDVRRGQFQWDNSASADLIAQANVGALCYAVDDHTVALTSGSSTRSVAGTIKRVETAGVWVERVQIP